MSRYLRVERRHPSRSVLSDGPTTVGWIADGQLALHGFPDAASAQAAAHVAERVIRQWYEQRETNASEPTVDLLPDAHGFSCAVPRDAWYAVLLELAQRLHVATISCRYPQPEPAA